MSDKYKYPRTSHLPYSPGSTSDDRLLKDTNHFLGKTIIITEKMDGECSSFSNSYIHARSLDSVDHLSRHWVKGLWGNIKHLIPEGWRVCGENMLAKHSIFYSNLDSFFLVFSVWDNKNKCLSWVDTVSFCSEIGLTTVPLFSDILLFDKNTDSFLENFGGNLDKEKIEGFVIRNSDSFHYDEFDENVAKYVRKNHVTTNSHWLSEWRNEEGYINKLKTD